MNVLIIGSGGREHALAWKIRQSLMCDKLIACPGNAGTASVAQNRDVPPDDFEKIGELCKAEHIELVVVGPEGPLVKGIRNYFQDDETLRDILMIGPDRKGALLEGSKDFSKQFMLRHGIPTARARTFSSGESVEALAYLESCRPPIVLKADGLAAGKGVIIASTPQEASDAVTDMLVGRKFGDASSKVLIEEFLAGIEVSVFVLTDGSDYVILPEAKDYKRIGEGDTGPNTGGMGAVSPVFFVNRSFMQKVEERIIVPTIRGLKEEGIHYCGFIFIGLMNVNGEPFVIEYNARMGDPETQAVVMRTENDMLALLTAAARGQLKGYEVSVDPKFAVTVSLVSGGYPGLFEKGKTIHVRESSGAMVFHAGTRMVNGQVVTDGGRVLSVTGTGPSLDEARKNAYACVSGIGWDGLYFRSDIGRDLETPENQP